MIIVKMRMMTGGDDGGDDDDDDEEDEEDGDVHEYEYEIVVYDFLPT